MTAPKHIAIHDYNYHLPADKIALHPLAERDASKLLIYKNEQIQQDQYRNIANYLPENSLLVFNNTRVINARIIFQKPGGSQIEIFCLEPAEMISEYNSVMNKTGHCRWKCFIGGASKWKEQFLEKSISISGSPCILRACISEKIPDAYIVEFSWEPQHFCFAEVLEVAGNVPLPPYIKRDSGIEDINRYQTIYAEHDGSVAAPTAGLHFTEDIFKSLQLKNIATENITLHVGAGTFKPVKATTMEDHEMHAEWIDVQVLSIQKLLQHHAMIIAVGTTSLRTLETLYWLGVKLAIDPAIEKPELQQWDVYDPALSGTNLSMKEALTSLLQWLEKRGLNRIFTQTKLLITPGYSFKVARALITNFHQPQSTLLLLVAAAIGDDWKKIYAYAMENEFRFLSYGDGSLIFMAGS